MKAEKLVKKLKSYKKNDSQIEVVIQTNQCELFHINEAMKIETINGQDLVMLVTDESITKTYRKSDVLKVIEIVKEKITEKDDSDLAISVSAALDMFATQIEKIDRKRFKGREEEA